MKIPTIAATALMLATTPAWAAPDLETIEWGQVGNWVVRVDPTLGNGCFVLASYKRGTVIRIGLLPENGSTYLMLGNADWASLEESETYELQMQFDERGPWVAAAPVINVGGALLLSMETHDARFIDEFALSREFIVRYRGNVIARLDLTGSHAAAREMTSCQEAMGTGSPSEDDPFAVTPTPSDPFA